MRLIINQNKDNEPCTTRGQDIIKNMSLDFCKNNTNMKEVMLMTEPSVAILNNVSHINTLFLQKQIYSHTHVIYHRGISIINCKTIIINLISYNDVRILPSFIKSIVSTEMFICILVI